MKPGIILLYTLTILSMASWANSQDELPGRTLPGGIWQPRNTHSVINTPIDNQGPFDILTDWGNDVRLSYFSYPRSHNSEIAVSGSHIYVIWEYLLGDSIFFAQSDDGGISWRSFRFSDDSTSDAIMPQLSASDSNVYVVYRAARIYWGLYMRRSSDYGQAWHNERLYYTARNFCEGPIVANCDSSVYVVSAIEVNYVPPDQDWDLWLFRSNDWGDSWLDTFFVSDSIYSGRGPDLVANGSHLHLIRGYGLPSSNAQEVLYSGSSDRGQTWFGPTIISDNDSLHSFWPRITAWGDSNVMVSWTDYKYSDYMWTGDVFISKSTDNGHSWSPPELMTYYHTVTGSDIYASGDTILLAYDDARNGDPVIYANISHDGGLTWEGEQRVSDSDYGCIEASAAISDGTGHVSWSDSRNNPGQTIYEIYYDQHQIETNIDDKGISERKGEFSLAAYPNPFNLSTVITVSNWKGGESEIKIFDLGGRMVKAFSFGGDKDDKKIVWDACDSSGKKVSSGIYFARVSTPQIEKTIKLLLLK